MYKIRLPLDGEPGNEKVIGAFSYSTGENLGDGKIGGTVHRADVASTDLNQKFFQMTVSDHSLNAGDKVDFLFLDKNGNQIIVKDAVITQSSSGKPGGVLQGVISATGKDQHGNDIAVHAVFDNGAIINKGDGFYDNGTESNSPDVVLDAPVNYFYLGNYPDIDKNENGADVDSPSTALIGVKANKKDVLSIVELQPVDTSSGRTDAISDNDSTNGQDGDDYFSYIHPVTEENITPQLDSSIATKAKLTYSDGTSETIDATVVQMDNGDVFIADSTNPGPLDGKTVHNIELTGPVISTQHDGTYDLVTVDNAAICFSETVKIKTPSGYIEVGKLKQGDIVETADRGSRPIRWIGRRQLDEDDLLRNPKLLPVRITKGALGNDLPTKDILVSRQHRMLVRSKIVNNMLGKNEVLIPAIKLIEIPGIEVAKDVSEVTYVHMLFDQHEIVFAHGAPTESLYAGPNAMQAISPEAREEILVLFPELGATDAMPISVRPLLSGKIATKLIARHTKNLRPLLS